MLVAKTEIAHGLQNPSYTDRYWQSSNRAMWAMSPPEKRCFLVKVINYDYVPLHVHKITLTTGDKRDEFVIKNTQPNSNEPLHTIGINDEHIWAVDAMPLFVDTACALQEDMFEEWQAANKKSLHLNLKKKKNDDEEAQKDAPPPTRIGALLHSIVVNPWRALNRTIKNKFKAAGASLVALPAKIGTKIKSVVLPPKEPTEESSGIKGEIKMWFIAAEDYFEEKLPPRVLELAQRGFHRMARAGMWLWRFLIYLPVFVLRVCWIGIKTASSAVWDVVKEPFSKYKPIKHKSFQAIIEFQNGWKVKSKSKVEVTYLFIEEKIMPLMFSAEELRPELELRNELLDACLKLLQIPDQPQ